MAVAGLSTLGITFGYGVETTAGTKPTSFKELSRINAIGGINVEAEQIDALALKDTITRYIQGRADTGGSFPVTVNLTDETQAEWEEVFSAADGLTGGKRMWFETIIPGLTKAFFVVAQLPPAFPQPESGQNGLLTLEFTLVIEEYKGLDAKVEFSGE